MSITKTLFPPSNREAAVVAFLRTFWQVVRATGLLGGSGAIVISAANLHHLDLTELLYIVGAVVASGVLSGALAAGDILVNGLPSAYQAAAVASIPVAQVSTVPVVTPADPDQPAAGTQPDPVTAGPALVIPSPLVIPAPVAADSAAPVVTAGPQSPLDAATPVA